LINWSISAEFLKNSLQWESYHGESKANHGTSGPVHVSKGGLPYQKFHEDFIQAVRKVRPDVEWTQDIHGMDGQVNKLSVGSFAFVSPRLSRR
jgi:hypothetical protein